MEVPALQADLLSAGAQAEGGGSQRARIWARFWRRWPGRLGLICLGAMLASAAAADLLASELPLLLKKKGDIWVLPNLLKPVGLRSVDNESLRGSIEPSMDDVMLQPLIPWGPEHTDLSAVLEPPSARHWLGTDKVGRDVAARLIHGARVSLSVGLAAVFLYVAIGLVLGLLAGYFGGWVDGLVSRLIEVMVSFPTLFLVLGAMAMLQRTGLFAVAVIIGLTRWPEVARLVRAEALRARELDYVAAVRALGASEARILLRHVLPATLGPVIVCAAFGVAGAILIESALSFLGFGAPEPTASWGEILAEANQYMVTPGAWWLALFPGLALFATVVACNLVGEGLRDALDPRSPG